MSEMLGESKPMLPDICLEHDDIHAWLVDLKLNSQLADSLRPLLSEDEVDRARRFRFGIHRRRFVVRRAALRIILERYVDDTACRLQFLYGPRGKPELSIRHSCGPVFFNSSHSKEVCLIAVTETGPLGIDIERLRTVSDADAIARKFFSAAECAEFLSVTEADRDRAFANCWTRKEAYVKALGEGLSIPLDSFDVTLLPGDPPRILADRLNGSRSSWSLYHVEPSPEYVGAIATEYAQANVVLRPFPAHWWCAALR